MPTPVCDRVEIWGGDPERLLYCTGTGYSNTYCRKRAVHVLVEATGTGMDGTAAPTLDTSSTGRKPYY